MERNNGFLHGKIANNVQPSVAASWKSDQSAFFFAIKGLSPQAIHSEVVVMLGTGVIASSMVASWASERR
jgi:hypothetical protein